MLISVFVDAECVVKVGIPRAHTISLFSCDLIFNTMARKLPIQKWIGEIAVQLKSHGESEIERN